MVAGALGGVFAWLGAAAQPSGLRFNALPGAGSNTVPAGVSLLGIGALAWALVPRLASGAVYACWAGRSSSSCSPASLNSNHWLLDTSIFTSLARPLH